MTDFDRTLEGCLDELEGGASTLDECLLCHPEHAAQLKPLLITAIQLEQGRHVRPSAAFKARARAKLTSHMQAHPRVHARTVFTFWRLAASLALLILALLVTGTAYAQSALPGDAFYEWKLASERVWRAVSSDPVGTDLVIANRRIEEMNAVSNDPVRWMLAFEGYLEVVDRLESELDAETLKRILPEIELEPSPLDDSETPIPTPILNATPLPSIPVVPIETPEIIPTIEIPPLLP